jgi:N-acetylneuraminate synthase
MPQTYIIAEVGINHNGDIQLAKDLILKARSAGCDAIKFQKRTVEIVYSKEELDTPRKSPYGTTTREQKNGIELSIVEYKELEKYTKDLGLDFIVSCWDINSINDIENNLDIKYHKVASAMVTDKEFLEKLNETSRPVILSVGMCNDEQVEKSIQAIDNIKYVLACTSTYPTKPEEVNLKYIETLKNKYPDIKIGFSNHYNGLDACVGAVLLGAVRPACLN